MTKKSPQEHHSLGTTNQRIRNKPYTPRFLFSLINISNFIKKVKSLSYFPSLFILFMYPITAVAASLMS